MKVIPPSSIIGIIGGGQLGRMTALAAANLGYRTHIYCPPTSDGKDTPAGEISAFKTYAEYDNFAALQQFAESVDVISFEFENIPDESIRFLEEKALVRPSSRVLYIAQNRIREKEFMRSIGVDVAEYFQISNTDNLFQAFEKLGKSILKTTELGYDGKGQAVIKNASDLPKICKNFNLENCVLEKFVPFTKEISVIVARHENGFSLPFPPAENRHIDGILDTSSYPANVDPLIRDNAKDVAIKIADELDLIGLLAVEFFVTANGSLIVNEIAPRPHNSGHWTMDGCMMSQFEQFVRAICGLPFGAVQQCIPTRMKNLLGHDINEWEIILQNPNAKLHLYGKTEAKKGRKMGHVNFINYT